MQVGTISVHAEAFSQHFLPPWTYLHLIVFFPPFTLYSVEAAQLNTVWYEHSVVIGN